MLVALTREISPTINHCELMHLPRTRIDVAVAREQHQQYENTLTELGCRIHRHPVLPDYPDGVFVEDTCVVLDELAVICRPGSDSRKGETDSVAEVM
jgi:dimethylargininase